MVMSRNRRKLRKIKKHSKAQQLLRYGLSVTRVFLHDLGILLGGAAYAAGHNRAMGWAEYEDMRERELLKEERERLRYLKRKKFIETKKIGKRLMVRLTAKGWQQILRDQIKCTRIMCKKGICVMVIFDVPESERHVRDTLRWILSECGFTMLQKSVWITRKEVVKELCALLQGAKLDRWVRIIVGHELKGQTLRRFITRMKAAKQSRAEKN